MVFQKNFFFYGFFPDKLKDVNNDLSVLSQLDCSIVFFISSKKFQKSVKFLKKNFSGREIVICREMTKYYEEFIRKKIDELSELNNDFKGELTVVISEKKFDKKFSQKLNESDKRIIKKMINKFSIKEITDVVNSNNRIPRKEIYNFCLKLKNEK